MEGETLELFHPAGSTSITRWECCTPGEPREAPARLQRTAPQLISPSDTRYRCQE